MHLTWCVCTPEMHLMCVPCIKTTTKKQKNHSALKTNAQMCVGQSCAASHTFTIVDIIHHITKTEVMMIKDKRLISKYETSGWRERLSPDI